MRTTRLAVALLTIAPVAALAAQIPKALIERTPSVATTAHTGVFGGQQVSYSAIVEEHILAGPDSVPNASGREMPYVITLPTMATSAWHWEKIGRKGRTVEQVYQEAVRFARTEYLVALVQGWSLPAAEKQRVAAKMSTLIGLPASYIEEKNLRVSKDDWMLTILKDKNLRTGMLDTRVTAARDINGVWNHEDRAETNSFIADAMRAHPTTRLFWTAGYFDLTTPAYGTQYSFDQVGMPTDRSTAAILPGPHGEVADEVNRALLASQLRKWIH